MQENLILAFSLTLFAGLATGIGSCLAFFCKTTNKSFLSFSLGFSAGVMIYVSFVEIFALKAMSSLIAAFGEVRGTYLAVLAFFGGMLAMLAIDMLVPSYANPHEPHTVEEMRKPKPLQMNLLRMGIFTAIAIAIHNFPEGLATFTSAMYDPKIGIPVAVAIAIHNIPEGISVSIPIFFATGSRKKAFFLSFLSGLSEPLGAIVGYVLLRRFFTPGTFGVLLAAVAGVMIYVAFDELLPTARKYGKGHLTICGVIAGMAIMALSLLLLM